MGPTNAITQISLESCKLILAETPEVLLRNARRVGRAYTIGRR